MRTWRPRHTEDGALPGLRARHHAPLLPFRCSIRDPTAQASDFDTAATDWSIALDGACAAVPGPAASAGGPGATSRRRAAGSAAADRRSATDMGTVLLIVSPRPRPEARQRTGTRLCAVFPWRAAAHLFGVPSSAVPFQRSCCHRFQSSIAGALCGPGQLATGVTWVASASPSSPCPSRARSAGPRRCNASAPILLSLSFNLRVRAVP